MYQSIPPTTGDMQLRARALSYYKDEKIRDMIAKHSEDKEVGIRFNDRFKRPDSIRHASDVLELAMQGATSFHASEERWMNPLLLAGNPGKKELDDMRTGWDLILDIDCLDWELAKAIAAVFIEALRKHDINSISCKFSGNKGFHIGVPFESFPDQINGKRLKQLFPEGPRAIASYLLDYIESNSLVTSDREGIVFHLLSGEKKFLFAQLPKKKEVLLIRRCSLCRKPAPASKDTIYEHLCENERCGNFFIAPSEIMQCPKCKFPLRITKKEVRCSCTPPGKSSTFVSVVNIGVLLDLDTLLISSRHLCRMAYSLHEKSGLASVPFPPENILVFDKKDAEPSKVVSALSHMEFLHVDRDNFSHATNPNKEATGLLERALEFWQKQSSESERQNNGIRLFPKEVTSTRFDEESSEKVPETCFPPCMNLLLGKLTDGKKRSLFILTNFLAGCNWTPAEIEERLKKWNALQDEPLRDTILLGHVRYHTQRSKIEKTPPPPNCDKYYPDLHVCVPDNLCKTIKNPLQYSKKRARLLNRQDAQNRKTKRNEQNSQNSEDAQNAQNEKSTHKQASPDA